MATQGDPRAVRWAEPLTSGALPPIEQHRNALRACALRLLGDPSEADEVVDEVLRNAGDAIALFRPAGSLGSWLQGLAIGMSLARLHADLDGASRGEKHTAPRLVGRSAFVRPQKLANG